MNLSQYLKDIAKIPVLSDTEIEQLGERILQGDKEARDTMVEHNLRLVVKIARSAKYSRIDLGEAIQEGNIGLIAAVNKFDYRKGFKLSTLATWYISRNIERQCLSKASRTIRLPINVSALARKYSEVLSELTQLNNGIQPTSEEIADKMYTTVTQVENIANLIQTTYSLDAPIGEEEEDTLASLIEDKSIVQPDEKIIKEQTLDKLLRYVNELGALDRKLISEYYGLNDTPRKTQQILGKELNLTPQRVGRIIDGAINKLRAISRSKQFQENPAQWGTLTKRRR